MNIAALAALALLGSPQSQDINNYVQTSFRDAQFTVRTTAANIPELVKINRDFAQAYRIKQSNVQLKEPFMLRMTARVEDTEVTFIVNGGRKFTRVPRSNINLTQDVSTRPGQRQTLFDYGLLTPSLVDGFFQSKFVRMDRATGDAVFDLTYVPRLRDSSRHRVWIDPETRLITRREWYGQRVRAGGRLMATFFYEKPLRVNGVWFSTEVSVNNADNRRAGTLVYEDIRANIGIDDSVFR